MTEIDRIKFAEEIWELTFHDIIYLQELTQAKISDREEQMEFIRKSTIPNNIFQTEEERVNEVVKLTQLRLEIGTLRVKLARYPYVNNELQIEKAEKWNEEFYRPVKKHLEFVENEKIRIQNEKKKKEELKKRNKVEFERKSTNVLSVIFVLFIIWVFGMLLKLPD
jgi:hypothetical protein